LGCAWVAKNPPLLPFLPLLKNSLPPPRNSKTYAVLVPHMDLLVGLIAATTSHIGFYGI